ncbi:MAG: RagB/SusD family nutrient uptake outer membrane protein [Gemmatimonadaceae bacterium]
MLTRKLTAVGLALSLMGCNDGFLATAPTDQIPVEGFWRTEQDAVLATTGLYPFLYGHPQVTDFDAASDNAWSQKTFSGWYPIGNGTADASSGVPAGFWYDSYRAIRRANEVLANIDKISAIAPARKSRLKGEARFHRAYHYNLLVNLFGDVPLVLQPLGLTEGKLPRTPTSQVVDQILADLDFAAGVLPPTYAGEDDGRVTKGAALALKARAALYARRWQVASAAAQAVIDLKLYSLQPIYRDLFTYKNAGSAEIILDKRYLKGLRSHNVFRRLAPRSAQGVSDIVPLRDLVDAYDMSDGTTIATSPLYSPQPDSMYLNRDPRMYATLLYPGATFAGKVYNSRPSCLTANPCSNTADQVLKDFNATATGYQVLKYVDEADKASPDNSAINFILIRYADVLLMYAEAQIEQGITDATVLGAINAVRARAGMPAIAAGLSQADLRDVVRHERRIELALEGLRLFDIRRWGIAETVMPGQHYGIEFLDLTGARQKIPADNRRFTAPRDYLWPIPSKELDLNPLLKQNPGY